MNSRLLHSAATALAFAACFLIASPSAAGAVIKGNGVVKTQERQVPRFTAIALELPAQVEVRLGEKDRVSVEADENLLPWIETAVENGTLYIRAAKRNTDIETRKLRVTVQARQIDQLAVAGAGSIRADALRSPRLKLEIGGSGAIEVAHAEAESVSAAIGGSGTIKLAGTAGKLSVSIGGSGDVAAGKLQAEDVNVSIGGSGQAIVWARASLKAAMAGSGDVKYYGDPALSASVVGSGTARRLGAAPQ
jgi:hypothetical protein